MATDILTAPALMTTEELLELPDDGKDRWLHYGRLREKDVTKRNRFHSVTMSRVVQALCNWSDAQPEPRGWVVCGEAGVILARNPDLTVGVDAAYFPADVIVRQTDATTLIEGVPLVVVEILSPSDTIEEIEEKIADYRSVGVPFQWWIDPTDRTVSVYRPSGPPKLFDETNSLTADPHLPGFRAAVADLFR